MTYKKKILCTLGPASFETKIIKRLDALGVDLFRINLSHTKVADLPLLIEHIQKNSDIPICLDTEGAQIRTGNFVEPTINLIENSLVRVSRKVLPGNQVCFNFIPFEAIDSIEIGDFISIDFNSVLVQVVDREDNDIIMRVLNGGPVGRNKAVTIERNITLPPLSKKDYLAIQIGLEHGLKHFALSFANCPTDVELLRDLSGDASFIISKIESLSGLSNLQGIAELSDALLIDRGDLSRQVALEQIPQTQKSIILAGKKYKKEVFVATNLLESMVSNQTPTRAEINDIYNTLLDGADGLVLAAETAVGKFPVQCASMIVKIIQRFAAPPKAENFSFPDEPISLLINPHGGVLIQRKASEDEKAQAETLKKITVSNKALLDCEQISQGTFSPLTGFMDSETLDNVLNKNRLLDGTVWPIPILLNIPDRELNNNAVGDTVALKGEDGNVYAILKISQLFRLDLEDIAKRWFMTSSLDHPGARSFMSQGNCFVAGEIKSVKKFTSAQNYYELTPSQTRFIFSKKSWSQIAGFHTRNPVHRGHEHIQKTALAESGVDGLYINPVMGPKKIGDFKDQYIMQSYQSMLDFGLYPSGKVVLGGFATYPRYAGPREAIFTAICRKNMGCSHFIIGRDHTGVGDFYKPSDLPNLLNKVGDFDIKLIFFPPIGFNKKQNKFESLEVSQDCQPIDGTTVRNAFILGERVESWIMRDVIQDILFDITPEGANMFVDKV